MNLLKKKKKGEKTKQREKKNILGDYLIHARNYKYF